MEDTLSTATYEYFVAIVYVCSWNTVIVLVLSDRLLRVLLWQKYTGKTGMIQTKIKLCGRTVCLKH